MAQYVSIHLDNYPKSSIRVDARTRDAVPLVPNIVAQYFAVHLDDGTASGSADIYLNAGQVTELVSKLSSAFRETMDGTPDPYREGAYDTEGRPVEDDPLQLAGTVFADRVAKGRWNGLAPEPTLAERMVAYRPTITTMDGLRGWCENMGTVIVSDPVTQRGYYNTQRGYYNTWVFRDGSRARFNSEVNHFEVVYLETQEPWVNPDSTAQQMVEAGVTTLDQMTARCEEWNVRYPKSLWDGSGLFYAYQFRDGSLLRFVGDNEPFTPMVVSGPVPAGVR